MSVPASHEPVNLTEAVGRTPWSEVGRALSVRGGSGGAVLEIHGVDQAEDSSLNDGSSETVYVVVAGYGVLRSADLALDFTAGDVLFVPSGCQHRLEQMDGWVRIWRISVALPDAMNIGFSTAPM